MGFDVIESALGSMKNHRLFVELLGDMSDEEFARFSRKLIEISSSAEEMKRYDVTYSQLGTVHIIISMFLSKKQHNEAGFKRGARSLKEFGIEFDYSY